MSELMCCNMMECEKEGTQDTLAFCENCQSYYCDEHCSLIDGVVWCDECVEFSETLNLSVLLDIYPEKKKAFLEALDNLCKEYSEDFYDIRREEGG